VGVRLPGSSAVEEADRLGNLAGEEVVHHDNPAGKTADRPDGLECSRTGCAGDCRSSERRHTDLHRAEQALRILLHFHMDGLGSGLGCHTVGFHTDFVAGDVVAHRTLGLGPGYGTVVVHIGCTDAGLEEASCTSLGMAADSAHAARHVGLRDRVGAGYGRKSLGAVETSSCSDLASRHTDCVTDLVGQTGCKQPEAVEQSRFLQTSYCGCSHSRCLACCAARPLTYVLGVSIRRSRSTYRSATEHAADETSNTTRAAMVS
jgi:hypothetical protein